VNDLNVIDSFMAAFITYIDSGFGLLGGDVSFLTRTLIGIDITLGGLFWAFGGENDVIARFLRKILTVGAFAFILNSFSTLAKIIFDSFAQAGLTAGGGTLSADDLLKPGRLAGTGFSSAWPLLEQASQSLGFTSFFGNFVMIAVLLFAWVIVIIAFFILAVQMFVTILEFKLTALAGFVLVPFALWNRTSFLAERVLGNVVSSGVKVMVLAVIVGIGSNFFSQFAATLQGHEPDIGQTMSLVLATLALFGLGIFGPSIAAGLVSGAPQLGAGAAFGSTAGAAGVAMLAGGATGAAGSAALGAVRTATSMGAAVRTAYSLGQDAGGGGVRAGLQGVARAGSNFGRARASDALGLKTAATAGREEATAAFNGEPSAATTAPQQAPSWARRLRSEQATRSHAQTALALLREGDRGGSGATPDLAEKED
jgi:type IV secretion system protein TrbL